MDGFMNCDNSLEDIRYVDQPDKVGKSIQVRRNSTHTQHDMVGQGPSNNSEFLYLIHLSHPPMPYHMHTGYKTKRDHPACKRL